MTSAFPTSSAQPKPIESLTESDLRLMRIFRAVAESGGLTAAEMPLRMERSTISRHIKALELRLGGCLCLRGPTGFELTELGHTVLQAAISACDTLDAVRDRLNQARNVLTGHLIVGIADNCLTNPQCRAADVLAQFAEEAPGVRIHVVVRPPVDLVRELHARHLHLCINGAVPHDDDFVRSDLFDEPVRLYAGRRGISGPVDVKAIGTLGLGVVTRLGEPHSERLPARFATSTVAVALGLEAVATLLASGRYIGYLPVHYAEQLKPIFGLEEVRGADDLHYSTRFFLDYERGRPLSAPGRRFRDLLREHHSTS